MQWNPDERMRQIGDLTPAQLREVHALIRSAYDTFWPISIQRWAFIRDENTKTFSYEIQMVAMHLLHLRWLLETVDTGRPKAFPPNLWVGDGI
jgi:hypothetical protein